MHYLCAENASLPWSIQFGADLLLNKIWYMLYLHIVHGFTLKGPGGMSLKLSIIEMLEFEE